jgi:hypothetical protein
VERREEKRREEKRREEKRRSEVRSKKRGSGHPDPLRPLQASFEQNKKFV